MTVHVPTLPHPAPRVLKGELLAFSLEICPSALRATHTCFLDTDGHPTCDACSTGHSGRHCER